MIGDFLINEGVEWMQADKFKLAEPWISWYDRRTEIYSGHVVLHNVDRNAIRAIIRIDPEDDFMLDAYECRPEQRELIERMVGFAINFDKYFYYFEFGLAI